MPTSVFARVILRLKAGELKYEKFTLLAGRIVEPSTRKMKSYGSK